MAPKLGVGRWALLCVAVLLAGAVSGFKPADFKTCEKATFCHRLRTELRASRPTWVVDKDTSFLNVPGGISFTMATADKPADKLVVTLVLLEDKTFRLTTTEVARTRYLVGDVLLPVKVETGVAVEIESDRSAATVSKGSVKAVVRTSPLSFEYYVDGEQSVVMNAQNLFAMECHREPEEGQSWEETFNGHKDTRRRGPEGISLDVSFLDSSGVFGIPERSMGLRLPATRTGDTVLTEPYRLYNLDVFEFDADHPFGLYGSIPYMVSHGKKRTAGVFWLNSSEMWVDVDYEGDKAHTQWVAESGILDVFVVLGPTPTDTFRQYSKLTGTTFMPPAFSLGYHQCRWNYRDEADVAAVDAGFEEHDMPYDVLWLDIEHTDGKRYFTWDKHSFPTPVDMQNKIAAKKRKMVTIIDPHIKRDDNYHIFSEGIERDLFVKNRDGSVFDGHCWPGASSYLDFTYAKTTEWWANQYHFDKYVGSTDILYTWNDMNEPSVFNGPETTMPKDALHNNGQVEHRDVHNTYGYLFHRASHAGHLERSDGKLRPFILSRSFFAGTQRYGLVWTGDNAANWSQLRIALPMILSVSVAGVPFIGADVGGFFGDPDAELQTRWYQSAVFYPFFRGHAHLDAKRREPWLFGEPHTTNVRNSLKSRYVILPYIYTLFYKSHKTGQPVALPLWAEFPADEPTYSMDQEMMLGNALLMANVAEPGKTSCDVYLPGGDSTIWYQLDLMNGLRYTGNHFVGGSTPAIPCALSEGIPVFQRGGTIVPRRDRPRRSVGAQDRDPYTLFIALDATGSASGELYIDDGLTTRHETDSEYLHVTLTYANGGLTVTPTVGNPNSKVLLADLHHVWVERIVVLTNTETEGVVHRKPAVELLHAAKYKI